MLEKSNVTSTGDIKIGDNNAGINGVTSNVTINAGELSGESQ